MVIKEKKYHLTPSHYKILETVFLLNKEFKYPLPQGVRKILRGENDPEVMNYVSYPTYKTLISFPSKKISRYCIMLLRYGYLEHIYDKKTDELYLKITKLGEISLDEYVKKHKKLFKQKEKVSKATIVEINNPQKFDF